jgi:hypothetical protein
LRTPVSVCLTAAATADAGVAAARGREHTAAASTLPGDAPRCEGEERVGGVVARGVVSTLPGDAPHCERECTN